MRCRAADSGAAAGRRGGQNQSGQGKKRKEDRKGMEQEGIYTYICIYIRMHKR